MKKYLSINIEQLNKLPLNVVSQVKDKLTLYSQVYIFFQNGNYEVSINTYISDIYAEDYQFIGIVYEEDIFTKEQINQQHKDLANNKPLYWFKKVGGL